LSIPQPVELPIAVTLACADSGECGDLELQAEVVLAGGGIAHYFGSKQLRGERKPYLNVDQGIFWRHPPAGDYCIMARTSEKASNVAVSDGVRFHATLQLESGQPLEVEGVVGGGHSAECFRFTVSGVRSIRDCRAVAKEVRTTPRAVLTLKAEN
jgi:hypothetical protein